MGSGSARETAVDGVDTGDVEDRAGEMIGDGEGESSSDEDSAENIMVFVVDM